MTTNSALFICAVCILAAIMDRHLGGANSTVQVEALAQPGNGSASNEPFWKLITDFLSTYTSPPDENPGSANPQMEFRMSGNSNKQTPNSHHPYMKTIYEEIEGKQHQKWTEMETQSGATIRGIEPYKVVNKQKGAQHSALLDFSIGMIHSLVGMRHVELILSTTRPGNQGKAVGPSENFQVELLFPQTPSGSMAQTLTSYSHQTFVFLELTRTIKQWWSEEQSGKMKLMRLRISRKDGAAFQLDRPLMLFYYTATGPEKKKDEEVLSGASELLRQARSVQMPPRACTHCVYGQRKQPLGDKQRRRHQKPCTLHQYYISLQALDWDNLFIAPTGFEMNYCSGTCMGPIADTIYNATTHAIVRAKLLTSLPAEDAKEIPPPYCVPTQLKHIDSMYQDAQGTIVVKKWENIVAEQCGCH